MTRPWRIEYEGALYHLLSRGNEGNDIFEDDRDRKIFLKTVGEMSMRFAMNDQIGQLFGLSYSAVSHAVKSLISKMSEDKELTAKFNNFYSQFKI